MDDHSVALPLSRADTSASSLRENFVLARSSPVDLHFPPFPSAPFFFATIEGRQSLPVLTSALLQSFPFSRPLPQECLPRHRYPHMNAPCPFPLTTNALPLFVLSPYEMSLQLSPFASPSFWNKPFSNGGPGAGICFHQYFVSRFTA